MANLKDVLARHREQFGKEMEEAEVEDTVMAAYDRSLAGVLIDLVDGNSAPEPKKRTYQRKKKVTTEPTTE